MALWHRSPAIAYAAVFAGVAGHASSEFVAVLSGVSGPEVSVWRFVLGSLGLVVLSLCIRSQRDLLEPLRECPVRLVTLSVVGVSGGYLLFHWALDFASVIQVATVVTVAPIFVGIANLVVNKQPIGAPKLVTGACAFIGCALLITDGYLARLSGSAESLVGVLMAIACAAIIGVYAVLIRPIVATYGALRITTVSLGIGAAGLWLLVGVSWGVWVNPLTLMDRDPGEALAIATLAFWNTTITQFLWIGGLAAVPDITRGTYLFFLKPVIAAMLAIWILGQDITTMQAIAIVVICASVVLEARWPWRAAGSAG